MFKLRQTTDVEYVKALHKLCFPADDWEDSSQHWIVWWKDTPVGFCSAKLLPKEDAVFLSRAGLLPCAQGAGLQRRMITTRLQWAKRKGATCALTYTVPDNYASAANLIKMGFQFYAPHYRYGGKDVLYFLRTL